MGPHEKPMRVALGDEPVVLKTAPAPAMTMPQDAARGWNTNKLGLRLGSDALAAAAAGALVAPVITIIDKGIIENASGRNSLRDSLKSSARELLMRPHRFLAGKPFALIFVRPQTLSIHTHPPIY